MKAILIALTLLMALPALAAPVSLGNGWTGEITIDTQRLPNVRFLQVRLVQAVRGWTVIEADDIPKATTPAQIIAWAQARAAWYDKMYVAFTDAQTRIGATISQGNWSAKLLASTPDPQAKTFMLRLQVSNATLGVSSIANYVVDDPQSYTIAALQSWIKSWLTTIDTGVTAKRIAPPTQDALDQTLTEVAK